MSGTTVATAGGGTRSTPWLARRHWRRALHLYLDGRISRPEFERMKERLTTVRGGAAATPPPPAVPRLRLVRRPSVPRPPGPAAPALALPRPIREAA